MSSSENDAAGHARLREVDGPAKRILAAKNAVLNASENNRARARRQPCQRPYCDGRSWDCNQGRGRARHVGPPVVALRKFGGRPDKLQIAFPVLSCAAEPGRVITTSSPIRLRGNKTLLVEVERCYAYKRSATIGVTLSI